MFRLTLGQPVDGMPSDGGGGVSRPIKGTAPRGANPAEEEVIEVLKAGNHRVVLRVTDPTPDADK